MFRSMKSRVSSYPPAAARLRIRRRITYQFETDPLKLAEDTAQGFLGIRMQCAQCHNHPFDRWTMNDYRGFVGFFSQIGRKKGEDPRETIVFNSGEGESKHPAHQQAVAAEISGRRRAGCQRQRSPGGACGLAGLAGQSLFRAAFREHHLGALFRPRDHRAGG